LELSSLHDDLLRAGQDPHTQVLHCRRVAAGRRRGDRCSWLRARPCGTCCGYGLVGTEPAGRLHNQLPADAIDLARVDLTSTGLYDALRAAGIHLRVAHQRIGARRADAREARLLANGAERRCSP
jgi:DNA-binding GntR family transcriptional regulator